MAKLKAIATLLLLAVLAAACGTAGEGKAVPPTPPTQEEQTKQQTDLIYIGRDKVPAEVARWAEDNKAQSKVSKITIGSLDAYLISWGQRPTAGYDVKISEVGFDAGDYWIIDLSITQPGPGDMTAQVITYPYEVLAVPVGTPVKLRLWNEKGQFQQLVEGQILTLPKPQQP